MVSRQRFSADVHQELLGRIIRGEYEAGQRLRDTELALEFGVSRTPVREALMRLEREGFVYSQKHLGFSVKGLSETEIREVYPLVRLMECTALEESHLPSASTLTDLGALVVALERDRADPFHRIELDSAWHRLLVGGYGNQHLARILAELKGILFRYEYSFMQDDGLVLESVSEHAAIVAALRAGDKPKAVRLLRSHWDRCTAATIADFARAEARVEVANEL